MSVVRRASAAAVAMGLVLLGGPSWAQEDPCAPEPDGSVPEMCQSGMPVSDTGTVGIAPEDPCPAQPVEPGDGTVSDPGDQGVAGGEPDPGAPPPDVEEGQEPERVDPEQGDPATEDASRTSPEPADGVICAFGVPVSAPGESTVLESSSGELPRTGPYDRLLALTAVGSGLVLLGTGAMAVGRRRTG